MPQLLRRRLRCFYCSKYSRNEQPGIPRTWFCGHCEAMNHLDEVNTRCYIAPPVLLLTCNSAERLPTRPRKQTRL
jgi:hypothetical protein